MISENDRQEIIEYRINQSKEVIAEVEKLIASGFLKVAVNRIYYGMFYILNAMALKYGFQTSKHLQLIGWLNKDFIKPGLIDKKYGEILRNAFKNRTDGDYAPFIEFEKNDVIDMFSDMKDFIYFIESFILTPN
jgi:uncharacterized protein (UPF0332 family)